MAFTISFSIESQWHELYILMEHFFLVDYFF